MSDATGKATAAQRRRQEERAAMRERILRILAERGPCSFVKIANRAGSDEPHPKCLAAGADVSEILGQLIGDGLVTVDRSRTPFLWSLTEQPTPDRQANEGALCDRTPNCIYPKGHPGSKCYVHPENRPENEGAGGGEPSEEYEEGLRDGVQMGRTAERAQIATDVARTARHLRAESEMFMHHEDYIPAHRCAAQAQALEDLHGELTGEHEEGAG